MAFLGSFDISASGMSAQRVRMDIAAENIANMDTTRTESGNPYQEKNVLLESYSDTSFAQAMKMQHGKRNNQQPSCRSKSFWHCGR